MSELCGKWMPKAKQPCGTPKGHSGGCRIPAAYRRHLERAQKQSRNAIQNALKSAKARAKAGSYPYTLTIETIPPIPDVCPVLGIQMFRVGGRKSRNSPSLDKIIPELGYVPSNVRWISDRANTLKSNATLDEMGLIYRDFLRIELGG